MNVKKPSKTPAILMILLVLLMPIAIAESDNPEPDNDIPDSEKPTNTADINEIPDPEDATSYAFPESTEGTNTIGASIQSLGAAAPSTQNVIKDFSGNLFNQFTPDGVYATDLFTGSASYGMNINVPPGRNGLVPTISLSYNHHQTGMRSTMGVGWALNQNFIYRDVKGTLSDTEDDEFKLHFSGVDLELIKDGTQYRTERETFWKIEKQMSGENEFWTVITRDGTQYRFGFNEDSELRSDENFVGRWSLDLVTDLHNNTIDYEYDETLTNEYYPYLTKISYNNRINEIAFEYAENEWQGFNGVLYGTKIKQNALLSKIVVSHQQAIVRSYVLFYALRDHVRVLEKIEMSGKDGNKFPATTFSYEHATPDWDYDSSHALPSEAFLGKNQDQGVRVMDVNGDGFDDIVKMDDTPDLSYWLSKKNSGFEEKQTISGLLPGGFINEAGSDLGVRLLDIDGDTVTDIVKLFKDSSTVHKTLANTQKGFQTITKQYPSEVAFIEKISDQGSCTPANCPSGYEDQGVHCENGVCKRACAYTACIGSGIVMLDEYSWDRPEWNTNDRDEEDRGTGFTPESNKCYKFEFRGSEEEHRSDDSQCYDLETDDYYEDDDYDEDCNGRDVDAYAGIGFLGNRESNTWVGTIPGGSDHGFTGDMDNSYWRYRYLSKYDKDSKPDTTGSNKGDWDGFNDVICDDAGTHTIHCAPTSLSCAYWGTSRCGNGCAGERTYPFVVIGLYADYQNNLNDAFNDEWDCQDSMIDDNDYIGENNHYKVTQYDTAKQVEHTSCSFEQYQFSDTGIRFSDINGDEEIDIIKATSQERKVWIQTEDGFELSTEWVVPNEAEFYNVGRNGDGGTRIIDINGDGLPDLVKGVFSTRITWINNGKGWERDDDWQIPAYAVFMDGSDYAQKGVVLVDMNGDALIDVVRADASTRRSWLNNGNGWTENINWALPDHINFVEGSSTLMDRNGDGVPDVVYSPTQNEARSWINRADQNYLLKKIVNSQGGSIDISYLPMTSVDNTGGDGKSDLSFTGWLVNEVTSDNGVPGPHNVQGTTTYAYKNGLYDPQEKEFRGFQEVRETRPDTSIKDTLFFQDKNRKGLIKEVILQNSVFNYFARQVFNYDVIEAISTVVLLHETVDETYDGITNNPRTTKTIYNYDDFGNIIKKQFEGDTAIEGDETTEVISYSINEQKNILDRPSTILLKDDDENIVARTHLLYDGLSIQEAPTKGELTQQIRYANESDASTTITQSYNYYANGNLKQTTNAKGATTQYIYDPTKTFIIEEINSLDHITYRTLDTSTGNVVRSKDPNGFIITYEYDEFGRITKEVQPYDSVSQPTTAYQYDQDGTAPSIIQVQRREQSGTDNTFDTLSILDGFGNVIQEKSESTTDKFITKDYLLDSSQRLSKQSNPYYSDVGFTQADTSIPATSFSYDTPGRRIETKLPDGSKQTITHELWVQTATDQNHHKIRYSHNANQNIVQVEEFNKNEVYVTSYTYNPLGNLVEVIDQKGNVLSYTYDDLGRKTGMNDPDLGNWSYQYDTVGNLIEQTDNKKNTITIEYDSLDRITKKQTTEGPISYEYDQNTIGTVSKIVNQNGFVIYTYDQRKRVTQENKRIQRSPKNQPTGTSILPIDPLDKSFISKFSYDAMDRLIGKELPNGEKVIYLYNNQNLLVSIPSVIEQIEYNAAGLPVKRIYNNTIITTQSYDPQLLRVQSIQTAALQTLSYEYDQVGNVKSIEDSNNNTRKQFSYDELDRLTNAQGPFNVSYIYDSLGNMLTAFTQNEKIEYQYSNAHAPSRMKVYVLNKKDFNLSLSPGWNLVSIPYSTTEHISNILGNSLGQKVFAFNNSNNKMYVPSLFKLGNGYWIKSDSKAMVQIQGDSSASISETFSEDWYLGGVMDDNPINISQQYKNDTLYVAINGSWASYNPDKPWELNVLKSIMPGQGFWIKRRG